MFFEELGYESSPVFLMSDLRAGHQVVGPAVIMDQLSTVLVEPDCTAHVTTSGDLLIHIGSGVRPTVGTKLDPIQLSIFSHRFMSIAEQMGRLVFIINSGFSAIVDSCRYQNNVGRAD